MSSVTDIQSIVTAITLAAGAIAGSIRWGTGKMARAQDRSIAALVRSAESNATLAAKFESLTDRIEALTTRFDRLVEAFATGGIPTPVPATSPTAVTAKIVRDYDSQRGKGNKKAQRLGTPRPDSNDDGTAR